MKKSVFTLLAILILSINLVSAAYGCSNGTIKEDINEISVGETENTNGIGISIIKGEPAGLSADILIDSKSLTLTNETSSIEIELLSGNYDVELINITGNIAEIKVEGDTGKIEKEETKNINNLQVHLIDVNGTYPGEDANAKLLIGIDKIFLYSNELTKTKKINTTDYLFEFFSSTTSNAIITVKKCENGDLIEIADAVPENNDSINLTTTNTTQDNETTQNSTINTTQIQNNQTNIT